jgi:hypothetical protein
MTANKQYHRRLKHRTTRTTPDGQIEYACVRCSKFFAQEDLVKNTCLKRGFHLVCKKCWAEQQKNYYQKNKIKIAEKRAMLYKKNHEKSEK